MSEVKPDSKAQPPKQKEANREFYTFKSLEVSPADKASTFIFIMHHRNAPESFNRSVVSQLQRWHLIGDSVEDEVYRDYEKFIKLTLSVREKVKNVGYIDTDFIKAFNKEPWNFDKKVEGEYTDEELLKFPRAGELKSILGSKTKFLFRAEPGMSYVKLVVREDGRRQVFRTVDTKRSIDQINFDAKVAPDIIPRFEAIRFDDGKTGLLINWIDGEMPSGQDEKALCLNQAEQLLPVPMPSYDLWAGNFVIFIDSEGNKIPYYIDNDVIEMIATEGLRPDTASQRLNLFDEGKKKM